MKTRLSVLSALVLPIAFALAPAPALAARSSSGPQVRILGFTTFPRLGIPQIQAKPGRTITACYERGGGMREVNVVYSGRGIGKNTKVGVALWGASPRNAAGNSAEPPVADTMRSAFKWPVRASESKTLPWGYAFAEGPFGPVDIDDRWTASVVVAGRTIVRKSVTIACE